MSRTDASLFSNPAEDNIRDIRGVNDDVVDRYHGTVLVGVYSKYTVIDTREQHALLGVSFRPDTSTHAPEPQVAAS